MTEALAAMATWWLAGFIVCLNDWRFGTEAEIPLSVKLAYWSKITTTICGAAFGGPWASRLVFVLLRVEMPPAGED